MIQFLREDQLGKEFKRISADGGKLAVVAPFWGVGAARLLGLKRSSTVQILCRFDSLACNPKALLELIKISPALPVVPVLPNILGSSASSSRAASARLGFQTRRPGHERHGA
jgi:hypothetical protein